jgi:hypothetical protein
VLARRDRPDAAAPGHEVRAAAASPLRPAAATIELGDEAQPAARRGMYVGGKLGDLVAEPLQRGDIGMFPLSKVIRTHVRMLENSPDGVGADRTHCGAAYSSSYSGPSGSAMYWIPERAPHTDSSAPRSGRARMYHAPVVEDQYFVDLPRVLDGLSQEKRRRKVFADIGAVATYRLHARPVETQNLRFAVSTEDAGIESQRPSADNPQAAACNASDAEARLALRAQDYVYERAAHDLEARHRSRTCGSTPTPRRACPGSGGRPGRGGPAAPPAGTRRRHRRRCARSAR